MMELPPEVKPDLGLDVGPRVFRKDGGAKKRGDTSCWTDTPADMERKAQVNLVLVLLILPKSNFQHSFKYCHGYIL